MAIRNQQPSPVMTKNGDSHQNNKDDDESILVRQVIAENPVEEVGIRDEWKEQIGWHRTENVVKTGSIGSGGSVDQSKNQINIHDNHPNNNNNNEKSLHHHRKSNDKKRNTKKLRGGGRIRTNPSNDSPPRKTGVVALVTGVTTTATVPQQQPMTEVVVILLVIIIFLFLVTVLLLVRRCRYNSSEKKLRSF